MNEPIRAVLFDKDGTLVDAFGGWIALNTKLFLELKARYGGTVSVEELGRALGFSGTTVLAGGAIASGTEEDIYRVHHRLAGPGAPAWDQFLPEIRNRSRELFADAPPEVKPVGNVKGALTALKGSGYRLGVATSDTYENAYRDLSAFGGEWIEYWASSDRVARPKPDPESVLGFAAFTGLPPAAIAFIGDSAVDLAAARAAGAGLFVAVKSPTCPPEVVAGADAAVDSIDVLRDLLDTCRVSG